MMEGKNMSECKDMCANGCGGMCGGKMCGCMHHKMIPVLVVIFGFLFLGQYYGWFVAETVAMVWPVLVILGGLTKLFSGMCKCC